MKSSRTVTAAWAGAVLTSCATIIPWRELSRGEPSWWPYVTLAGLLALLEATYMRADIRPLKMYVLYLLFVYVLGYGGGLRWGLVTWVKENAVWIDLMNELPPFLSEIALHLLRLVPMFIVLGTLLVEGRKLGNLYLKKGNLNAVAAPSRLIGTIKPEPWTKVGTIFTAVFCAGTLSFLILTTKLTWDSLPEAIGTLPTVVVIAALNAFNEEFTLRAAPLSMLESAVGREQALRVTTFFFGVGHYYGVPHGVVGVLLAGFLGWFLGKSMQETGGFMWAWLIHFLQGVKIFTFSLM